jgi:cobalt-zinc-cadmium efflux system outer membrane protein
LELFRRIETLDRKLRDAAEARLQTGEGTKLEANLEAIRYDQSRRNTFSGNRDYRNALRDLNRITGIESDESTELNGSLSARPINVDPASLVSIALTNRPDLGASDAEIRRVEADTALTKRLIIPNPVIGGTYSREPSGPGSNFDIAGGSIGISIPIFDHKQAELAALAGERLKATYDRRAVLLNIGAEVRDAAESFQAASETVGMFESDTMSRVEENFRFIETTYRAGKINLLQLVVVQNDLVSAELSYLDALWDYWSARTNLEFAIGADLDKAVSP